MSHNISMFWGEGAESHLFAVKAEMSTCFEVESCLAAVKTNDGVSLSSISNFMMEFCVCASKGSENQLMKIAVKGGKHLMKS